MSSTDQPLEALEKDHFKIDHSEVGAEFMKKWWAVSKKVADAAMTHHEPGTTQGKKVTLNQIVRTATRIANQNEITHPVMTAFEDPPEEGYLENLGITQEDLDIVIDTTKIGLMAAETVFRGN